MGFVSRLLPVTYRYSQECVTQILSYITQVSYREEDAIALSLPDNDVEIKMSQGLATSLLPITQQVAKAVGTYGFRVQRQAQTLAMARALLAKRQEVAQEDVNRIYQLLAWANLKFEPINLQQDSVVYKQSGITHVLREEDG